MIIWPNCSEKTVNATRSTVCVIPALVKARSFGLLIRSTIFH